ncbi:dipeptide ABC transporter ATP-binding protein [Psychromarinibacter halotolerans]|uniref:Dipeptide ABC transporter ATP-binding protein n=1 Tax=Psychromarinibacter halotolerans TaxID=1775175 RepID=A0ABV7GR97_9RHOB|nr:ABC transporter ATP-binding protein [Psychromarinibacter halotolerans]MDF0595203.1 ABC transporter ATP-binding protein [Psychromarinibacter halotolerans]
MTEALQIEGLRVEYPRGDDTVMAAVDGLSLSIGPGEIHALVGESGAGKSTVGNCIMGLLDPPGRIASGSIRIAGRALNTATGRVDGLRPGRDIGAIFQDPMTALNPLFTIGQQLSEGMRHHLKIGKAEARAKALELLRSVEIPEPEKRLDQYPHQLSGGQRQRVVIASALSCDPDLLVADEPTTALDVSVQATILDLLRDLASRRKLGVLLITHNMGVVAQIADHVTIMRHGQTVESGPSRQVLGRPSADYAKALIGAVPRLDRKLHRFPVIEAQHEGEAAAQEQIAARVKRTVPEGTELLSVENVGITYGGGFLGGPGFKAVEGASFAVKRGEIFGIVGESGSGKSTLATAIAGLLPVSEGRMRFRGEPLRVRRPIPVRRAIQMIFQDPYSSLNPRMRTGAAIHEPLDFYDTGDGTTPETLVEAVGLPRDAAARYPHAFSGGQRQRISIARALAGQPDLLICDEPTSALDVSVQARVLNLLKDLRDRTGLTMLFISHDLSVVRQMCDRIAVMKSGRIVELEDAETLFTRPRDPYTRDLLSLIPTLDGLAAAPQPAGAPLG